jgi:hypothetical protein
MDAERKDPVDDSEIDNRIKVFKKIKDQSRDGVDQWVSCCYKCNKNAVVFFSQLIMCVSVVCFCMIQLYNSDSCNQDALYSGIMMLILGAFLPTPKIKETL